MYLISGQTQDVVPTVPRWPILLKKIAMRRAKQTKDLVNLLGHSNIVALAPIKSLFRLFVKYAPM